MEKEIIIKVKYTFQDFILPVKEKLFKSWGIWLAIVMGIGMIIGNLLYLFDINIYENGIPLTNIILPIGIFIVFPIVFNFVLKKHFNKNYLLKEETIVTYNQKGMLSKSKSVSTFTEWDKIKSIKEHKKYFVLKNISGLDSYINKNFFSDNKLNDFKLLIKSLNF